VAIAKFTAGFDMAPRLCADFPCRYDARISKLGGHISQGRSNATPALLMLPTLPSGSTVTKRPACCAASSTAIRDGDPGSTATLRTAGHKDNSTPISSVVIDPATPSVKSTA